MYYEHSIYVVWASAEEWGDHRSLPQICIFTNLAVLQVMMLYTKIEAMADQYTYDVEVSYVEIYNEKLKDLLSPS